MSDNVKKTVVIALGYFDSVHIGHQKVISVAVGEAKKAGVIPAVFSFDGNLRKFIGGADGKYVFTAKEREELLFNLGVKEVFFAPVTTEFLGMGEREFLDYLNGFYNIVGYVSGDDYRFGYKGAGDVNYLKSYADKKGQFVVTVPPINFKDVRVSTTYIKGLMKLGEMEKANQMLGGKYFLTGKVEKGRKVGRLIGFPTVNIPIDYDRSPLKKGVYAGSVLVDGKEYKSVINYGDRPTFDLQDGLIESHIIDFDGDLYGKTVRVRFDRYLRDIKKFDGEYDLKLQLEKDVSAVKGTTL